MSIKWLEFGMRTGLIGLMFLFILIAKVHPFPIVELCVMCILCALFLLADRITLPKRYLIYFISFVIIGFFIPILFYFWPVLLYDYPIRSYKHFSLFLLVAGIEIGIGHSYSLVLFLTGLSVIASLTHTIIEQSQTFEKASYAEIDTLRFLNQRIKNEQEQLLHLQDEKVYSSRMQERKRIVEEIHDLLGHQLSSAIIQIGALEYVVPEPEVKTSLQQIKSVLSSSMNNVRSVIHTERQTTIHLEDELQQLIHQFTKCPIHFQYQNTSALSNQQAHSIVNIVKEALTNINKHSNATSVQVRFAEMTKQWTLLVADNGTAAPSFEKKGIGLLNIEERVDKMTGKLHVNVENGFRIFIVLPKEEEME